MGNARSSGAAELTVLYDGVCSLCRDSAARLQRMDDHGRRIELVDLHSAEAARRFPQIDHQAAMRGLQAVDRRGRVYGGIDAWARIGLTLPGWKLVAWLLLVPGINFLASHFYAWVARNRYRWNPSRASHGRI
jgi:predicted DCC family thiol-disulfide oxidoreductase YuxK